MLGKLSIAWLFIKKYWSIFLAVAIFLGAIVLRISAQARVDELNKQLEEIEKRHREDLEKINTAHNVETTEREKHIADLEATLKAIELRYAEEKKYLDESKRREVIELVQKYGDDTEELARRLSEATGIPISLETK